MNGIFLLLTGLFLFTANSLWAQDLDHEAARLRYDEARREADQKKSDHNREVALLRANEANLERARQDLSRAESNLANRRADLARIDDEQERNERRAADLQLQINREQSRKDTFAQDILRLEDERDRIEERRIQTERQLDRKRQRLAQLEREDRGAPWICSYIDAGQEEHHPHEGRSSSRDEARRIAEQACLAVHGQCEYYMCQQEPSPEIEQLRRDIQNLEHDRDLMNDQIARKRQEIEQKRDDIEDCEDRIFTAQRDVEQLRITNQRLARERDRTQLLIDDARREVSISSQSVASAQNEVERQRVIVADRKRVWDEAEARAAERYRYYQTVLANYNRELERVYAAADRAADQHAGVEAEQRAPSAGQSQGSAVGTKEGTAKGGLDARDRDRVLGYRQGRAQPRDAQTLTSYEQGRQTGLDRALVIAGAEDYPRGYNDILAASLTQLPRLEEIVDLSEDQQLPENPGSAVSTAKKQVGDLSDPAFPMPADAVLALPSYQAPAVTAPSADQSQHQPPCDNLILPEFGPKCVVRYTASYRSSFERRYIATYLVHYRSSYDSASSQAYRTALERTDTVSFQNGALAGARDQGELDGFAANISRLRQEAYARGKNDFLVVLNNGTLLSFPAADLEDPNQDGVISPAEEIPLSLTVDNRGGKTTAHNQLRLRITAIENARLAGNGERHLPALAAESRVQLKNILKIIPEDGVTGRSLRLSGVVETTRGEKLFEFTLTKAISYPIELVSVDLAKDPALQEVVAAKAVFRNASRIATSAAKAQITTQPRFAEVLEADALVLNELQPGQTQSVDFKVKPGIWVGENTALNFKAQLSTAEGAALYAQIFPKLVHINRTASLLVFDAQGQPRESGMFTANAGSTFTVKVQMKYHATTRRNGPFIIEKGAKSHPTIGNPNNSTISVNYGSWGPGSVPDKVTFSFIIPQDLRGQRIWVMPTLKEGSQILHAAQLFVDVK